MESFYFQETDMLWQYRTVWSELGSISAALHGPVPKVLLELGVGAEQGTATGIESMSFRTVQTLL